MRNSACHFSQPSTSILRWPSSCHATNCAVRTFVSASATSVTLPVFGLYQPCAPCKSCALSRRVRVSRATMSIWRMLFLPTACSTVWCRVLISISSGGTLTLSSATKLLPLREWACVSSARFLPSGCARSSAVFEPCSSKPVAVAALSEPAATYEAPASVRAE